MSTMRTDVENIKKDVTMALVKEGAGPSTFDVRSSFLSGFIGFT